MVRTYSRNPLSRFLIPCDATFLSALPRSDSGKILERLPAGPAAAQREPPPSINGLRVSGPL
ncbi:hypothetical protein AB4305_20445 [Nocardia sp. 2YAB30]|uniref:hypothetical protein n=1 Tax=unclassified Nocardia TaxID=2637762 RepID=UPI003F95E9D1